MNVDSRLGETAGFRADVQSFLRTNLPSGWAGIGSLPAQERDEFYETWRAKTAEHRLLAVSWPIEYGGRGLTKLDHLVVVEEFARAMVPLGVPGDVASIKLIGNTLVAWGTEEQKRRFLPRIISGEDRWCQGYSEPDSGSDLASLRTRAVLSGERWRLDGQKIWTSNAAASNWIFVLARTDPTSRGSRGLSFLLAPLAQPGIEVRPIRMLTNGSDFCEVFFTDADTDADNIVGAMNDGWSVANSLLAHERGEEAAVNPTLFAHELSRVIRLAVERGTELRGGERERLGRAVAELTAMKGMGDRILARYVRDGSLGPVGSITKLFWSEYHKRVTDLALDLLGTDALKWEGDPPLRWYRSDDPGAPNSSTSWLTTAFVNALSGTVYAGTSQVQRNIIGERMLGLPRQARPQHA